MTPAAFDTLRRSLGLSVAEIAAMCGNNERTVSRWIAGTWPLPEDAIDALEALEALMNDILDARIGHATDKSAAGPITLLRYRTQAELDESPHGNDLPLGAHAILTQWLADAFASQGLQAEIQWSDD